MLAYSICTAATEYTTDALSTAIVALLSMIDHSFRCAFASVCFFRSTRRNVNALMTAAILVYELGTHVDK